MFTVATGAASLDLVWWITAVELPVVAALFFLIWRQRQELMQTADDLRSHHGQREEALRGELSAFKLEVAKSYASTQALKDVEVRLTAHLVRIEQKLDGVPLAKAGAER